MISFPSPYTCCWSLRLPLFENPWSLIFSLFPRGVTCCLGWIRLKLTWLTKKKNKTAHAKGSLLEEELWYVLSTLYQCRHIVYMTQAHTPWKTFPCIQCIERVPDSVGIRSPRPHAQLYLWLPVWQREPLSSSLSLDTLIYKARAL